MGALLFRLFARSFVVVSVLLSLTACGQTNKAEARAKATPGENSTNSGAQAAAAPERREFKVRGVIKEFRPAEKEVVIKHEAIPDYMDAMTMPFEVKSTNEFRGLSTNDEVSFTMVVTEKEGWIENLKKIGVDTNSFPGKERPAIRLVRDVEPLNVGDKMSDYTFTNSLGEKVKLSDFAGQSYAFTFIFTRCPFPNFCPRMSSNFSDAYKQLEAMKNGPTNWHFLSISFDPDFDTPERLREYSATYHPDLKKWDWVSGAMIDIDAIADQFGLVFAYENGTFNHTLRTVVVDKNGRVRKVYIGNSWQPGELVDEMVAGAKGEPIPKEE